ncbi:MAG: alanine racemase [Ignavibacteria bacterium]|nr:alanine racemase [Ignavibacteria bacterium]
MLFSFCNKRNTGQQILELQLRKFKEVVKAIEESILKFELRHISNTGGILNFSDGYFNMVRPGISLYGFYPDEKKVKNTELGLNR